MEFSLYFSLNCWERSLRGRLPLSWCLRQLLSSTWGGFLNYYFLNYYFFYYYLKEKAERGRMLL